MLKASEILLSGVAINGHNGVVRLEAGHMRLKLIPELLVAFVLTQQSQVPGRSSCLLACSVKQKILSLGGENAKCSCRLCTHMVNSRKVDDISAEVFTEA